MTSLRTLSWCAILGLSACDQYAAESTSSAATQLPDREETYKPSPEEITRANSLGEFEGRWLGKIHVISDVNGVYREYTDGIEFRIYIDGNIAWAELLLDGEWTLFTDDAAHVEKNESSVLISRFHIEGAYEFTATIAMHRAEPNVAKVWLIRTTGTPYRSGTDVWKNHAVFTEGEVRYMD